MSTSSPADRQRVQEILDDLWGQITTPGTGDTLLTVEVLLDTPAGSPRIGRDVDGLPHLLVPLPAGAPVTELLGTDGVSIRERILLVADLPVRFLDLGCMQVHLARAFAALAVDICLRMAVDPSSPVAAVHDVIEEWRDLLERRATQWTRSRSAGLFAELAVLRRLLAVDPDRLDLWTGPSGQAQDFRGLAAALEVKATIGGEGRVVRIHGSDQLEEPANGDLHLAWFRLDDRHTAGRSLRQEFADIASAVSDKKKWSQLLQILGVPDAEHPEVDIRKFLVTEERWYRVDDSFPRIVPASFLNGALPAGVGGVEYLVDLDVVPTTSLVTPESVLQSLCGMA